MKKGHVGTEEMMKKVCGMAQAQKSGPAGPSLSEVLGSSAALPEATTTKKGGSDVRHPERQRTRAMTRAR